MTSDTRPHAYDPCPSCDRPKRKKSARCAACAGYGRGRHVRPDGYVRVWVPGHPLANADGYAQEHRYLVYEAGIALPDGFHVHHINGDKADNRLENLEVIEGAEHHRRHAQLAGYAVNQYGVWPLRGATRTREAVSC